MLAIKILPRSEKFTSVGPYRWLVSMIHVSDRVGRHFRP
jgi:hypothetical protein